VPSSIRFVPARLTNRQRTMIRFVSQASSEEPLPDRGAPSDERFKALREAHQRRERDVPDDRYSKLNTNLPSSPALGARIAARPAGAAGALSGMTPRSITRVIETCVA
jgi:hypothetical protein